MTPNYKQLRTESAVFMANRGACSHIIDFWQYAVDVQVTPISPVGFEFASLVCWTCCILYKTDQLPQMVPTSLLLQEAT